MAGIQVLLIVTTETPQLIQEADETLTEKPKSHWANPGPVYSVPVIHSPISLHHHETADGPQLHHIAQSTMPADNL